MASLCHDESKKPLEECIMSSGNDQLSYTKNSTYQGRVIEVTKPLINEAISKKFLAESLLRGRTICIADLGCSIGPNTFISMQNIIESITSMYKSNHGQNKAIPLTFQVFFSDHTSNDFNTLFKSLPVDRQYYASGVPGSFYGRLFPPASLHFVHSSFSLHWLSTLPEELLDKNSLAWNKGKIDYTSAGEEVAQAYAAQRRKDLECFLLARAEELVPQGLMMIVVPARPNGVSHSHILFNILNDILGSCLMEMVKRIPEGTSNNGDFQELFIKMKSKLPSHRFQLWIVCIWDLWYQWNRKIKNQTFRTPPEIGKFGSFFLESQDEAPQQLKDLNTPAQI